MSDDQTPPSRVRISRLQEVQLPDLVKVDQACAAQYHAIGFDAAEVPARTYADLVHLTRDHNVFVVEADWQPSGYAAWRDEEPGVAYVEEINVHPDLQRFGLGAKLIEAIRDDARKAGLKHIVLRAWLKASWAIGFYRKLGFVEVDGIVTLPGDVMGWVTSKKESGRPVVRPGEVILFGEVGAPPAEPEEEAETDATGESE